MAKELVPTAFSYVVWDPILSKRHTEFYCDNQSLFDNTRFLLKTRWSCTLLDVLGFSQPFSALEVNSAAHILGLYNSAVNMHPETR